MSYLKQINTNYNDRGNHICSLPTETANVFEADTYYKIFKNITKISKENPITKFYFRSLTAIEKEHQRHVILKKSKWIIHPLSLFRFYWECFYMFALYIGLFIIPLNFINGPTVQDGQLSFGYSKLWESLVLISDILFIADVVMTLFTGYCVYNKKVIHLEWRAIAVAYVSTIDFYFDIICCLTGMSFVRLYMILYAEFYYSKYIIIFEAVQIWRLKRFLKYLNNVTEKINHFYYSRLTIRYFSLIYLILHWFTCIFIRLLQDYLMYSPKRDYILYTLDQDMPLLHSYMNIYIQCQNIMVSHLLGISNFHDIPVANYTSSWTGLIQYIVFSLIGFILNNVIMILLLQIIISLNASEAKYHSIMSQLLKYMSYKTLPRSMRDRIICYYDYRFQKQYFSEIRIMSMLSESLVREINLYSCRSLIEGVSILRDLPPDIISEVVFHLQHQVFLYNDIIVKAGTTGDCMYFIANGTIAVLTPTGREICHLQDGAYFGEIALISDDQRRIANVIAIEICEVYRLDRVHFRKCFDPSSTFYKRIEQIAQERMEKTILLEQLHKKYLMDHNVQGSYSRKGTVEIGTAFL